MAKNEFRHEPIAVIGIGALFPGSHGLSGFWRDIVAGRDLISDIPTHYWLTEDYYDADIFAQDKTYAKRGAFLSKIDFDPMYYGIPPKNIPCTDTSQLLALVVARQVLEDAARGPFESVPRDRMSCVLGVAAGLELLGEMAARLQKPIWVKAMRELGVPEDQVQQICDHCVSHTTPWSEATFPGLLGNVVAGRVTNRFDLGGLNCTTDAACASSMSSLSLALDELWLGHADVVLTGGVDTCQDPFLFTCFCKTPAMSFTGDCRPFSEKADGTMLGEGVGMVALKRLSEAERDHDHIYAVIKGIGASSDGRAKSIYAPSAPGQALALARAYQVAGFGPETVELVEAHGTGTRAGDAAEVSGLRSVFDPSDPTRHQWCALGTIKSQFGHTKSAAGAAGLIKTVMALHHKVLPPTIKVEKPDPEIEFGKSAFYLNTETRPWIRSAAHPRRAAVSSAGFGGTNFHCVLEEYAGPAPRMPRRRTAESELVLFSGQTPAEVTSACEALTKDLRARVERLAEKAACPPGVTKAPLGDDPALLLKVTARASQESFSASAPVRLAVVAQSDADLLEKIEQARGKISENAEREVAVGGVFYAGKAKAPGKIAFLFSGQGSQYVGMGKDVAMAFDEAREVWDEAAGVLFGADPPALHEVVFPRPVFSDDERAAQQAQLTRTEWAQPGLGVTSAALLGVLRAAGVEPDCVGGHSFGEVTALHAAGVLDLPSLVRVARRRGELMAEAAKIPGSMSAVGNSIEEVKPILDEVNAAGDTGVVIANHNSPKQVVLSGPTAGIEKVEAALKQRKLVAKRLPVATAFHSPVVAGSEPVFASFLAGIELKPASIPVFANSSAAPYPTGVDEVRTTLAGQISRPVRFAEEIEGMYASGVRTFVEVGAGNVLKGLCGACLKGVAEPVVAVSLDNKAKDGLTSLWLGLGELAVNGVDVDFGALWAEYEAIEDPRTAKKPVMWIELDGMNYDRPYPPKNGAAGLPKPNPPKGNLKVIEPANKGAAKASGPSAAMKKMAAMAQAKAGGGAGAAAVAVAVAAPAPAPAATKASVAAAVSAAPPPQPVNAPSRFSVQAPVIAPALGAASPAWLQAYQAIQSQTTEAHAVYQRSMAEAHIAFLRTAETSTLSLTSLVTGQPLALTPAQPMTALAPAYAPAPAPVHAPAITYAPAPAEPLAAALAAPELEVVTAEVVDAKALVQAKKNPFVGVDLKEMLFKVVADKTGYPTEILNLDMSLESDLGIDSIKRVEILSAIQDQAPDLPQVDAAEVAGLQTLGEVLKFMERYRDQLDASGWSAGGAAGAPAALAAVPVAAPRAAAAAAAPQAAAAAPQAAGAMPQLAAAAAAAGIDRPALTEEALAKFMDANLKDLLFGVVADKTGYPPDILNLEMSLEADLGIDSIKRVEILSAFQDQLPGLPEVDAAQMATLQSLGEVLDYMERMRTALREGKLEEFLGKPKALPAPGEASAVAAPIAAAEAGPATGTHLLRLVVQEVPAEATGFAMAGIYPEARAAVIDDGAGVADEVVARLNRHQLFATKVAAVADVPADTDVVVYLGGLRAFASDADAIGTNRDAFALAHALAPRFAATGGVFVTVQDTGGDFGLAGADDVRAWAGGLPGLVKTARFEWPEAAVKAIDIERGGRPAAEVAAAIVQELLRGGPEVEIGLHADGRRTSVAVVAAPPAVAAPGVLDEKSVVVAVGGGRGVTAATLIELARARRPRLALVGRTALFDEPELTRGAATDAEINRVLLDDAKGRGEAVSPRDLGRQTSRLLANREVKATLAALAAAGSEAIYVTAPVQDAAALCAALAEVRAKWGPITAVIHGAGVLRDKLIADKTVEQFTEVFDTKVLGLKALLAATAGDPLTSICLFSSVAGRHGNRGQCDYAMANEILNKVAGAEARRRPGCVVKAINWGPWQGGMVTPTLEKILVKMGVPMIPLSAGGAAMVAELTAGAADGAGSGVVEVLVEATNTLGERFVDPNALDTKVGILVDETTHPFLNSHRIANVPVVPVVLVLEWFTRAASACYPALTVTACRDLRVLKGIRLEAFGTNPTAFTLSIKRTSNGKMPASLDMELTGAEGVVHYRAVIALDKPNGHSAPRLFKQVETKLEPWPWSSQQAYADKLFHGDQFQVIRSLEGVSREIGVGTLAGVTEMGWPTQDWHTDPAALDGGLQLALLWGAFVNGKISLPTRVEEYVSYTGGAFDGPVHCVLTGREVTNNRTKLDLAFATDDGHLAAEMRGVEMHALIS